MHAFESTKNVIFTIYSITKICTLDSQVNSMKIPNLHMDRRDYTR